MKLFVFFGLPATGKTFVGNVAKKYFDYHIYDGDNDMPPQLFHAIQKQKTVTDDMRDVFFTNLITNVKKIEKKYEKVIVSQTFIKEKYRKQFQKTFPYAQFILIETDTPLREKRFLAREKSPFSFDLAYERKMVDLFEKPGIIYKILKNNLDGEASIREQLQELLD